MRKVFLILTLIFILTTSCNIPFLINPADEAPDPGSGDR